jgi:hypothetical protein
MIVVFKSEEGYTHLASENGGFSFDSHVTGDDNSIWHHMTKWSHFSRFVNNL